MMQATAPFLEAVCRGGGALSRRPGTPRALPASAPRLGHQRLGIVPSPVHPTRTSRPQAVSTETLVDVLDTPLGRIAETLVAGSLAYAAACYEGRPRGGSKVDPSLCEVRVSPVHGRGVFAVAAPIPEGTRLGTYPGRMRSPEQMREKLVRAPASAGYCFQTDAGLYLDPTDEQGEVSSRPSPGPSWPFEVDPTLAFVNEPPAGQSVNVDLEDSEDGFGLVFVAARDIARGEELYIDYGADYDRSGYQ